jgi:phosphoribosyl-AMP cyclohydrolase / phosphoribosyl-ATP pyrophosphohydrolase
MKLWPAIVQESQTGEVLMLGYMNELAMRKTESTGFVHFWSRSRNKLWRKGETSGNTLLFKSATWDCDQDALLIQAVAAGPTCHLLRSSCFRSDRFGVLEKLERAVESSLGKSSKTGSQEALARGPTYLIRKLQEESTEVGLAVAFESKDRLCEEAADLMYRLVLLLQGSQVKLDEVARVLETRRAPPVPLGVS